MGIPRLWTRHYKDFYAPYHPDYHIYYKKGWGPWSYLPIYLTTVLLGTLLGYGVTSPSRAWYVRSIARFKDDRGRYHRKYLFASAMTDLLDWIDYLVRHMFKLKKKEGHGATAGPPLWGTTSLRRMT